MLIVLFIKLSLQEAIVENMLNEYKLEWRGLINRDSSNRNVGGNKLRTYCTFKSTFGLETYCKTFMPLKHRSAFAKFRFGSRANTIRNWSI